MLLPKYYFSNEYTELYDYFLSQPHKKKHLNKGDFLRGPGETITECHYIISGLAVTFVTHENGHRKILDLHGEGDVTPGCHESEFKIEMSIDCVALTEMETLCFPREQFYRMFKENDRLNSIVLEVYAKYINLLIYEAAHQKYNNLYLRLCNLLYLIAITTKNKIQLSQDYLADILGTNRVNITRYLSALNEEGIIKPHRGWIEVLDLQKLQLLCSEETIG